jgi:two-component system phosphate regulon sensor histidine kinase PhoR
LERAVDNLVDNAIKYTPEGGTVRVRTESVGSAIAVSGTDTGVGIPESDSARVFERFYRVDKSRSRELGGTRLGWAIVKHIAQLHGGDVTVRSQVGVGSVFTLTLPLNRSGGT